jgi:integrase
MNKRCVMLTDEQYKEAVSLLRTGFELDGRKIKPNNRIATIAVLQTTIGLRLGDCLALKMSSFLKDGDRYTLNIIEQKTKKERRFTVPIEVYSFIQNYALDNCLSKDAKLFDISNRQVERHLNLVFTKMKLPLINYGSHSFRKTFATKVYMENDMNIELVRTLLQHSSVSITQRYIGVGEKVIENALAKTANYIL